MTNKIQQFIDELSIIESQENFTNLYFGDSSETEIRKSNLNLYLENFSKNNSKILLLGEAPGYKGCKNTGIAFTCENTLKTNEHFKNQNYKTINSPNYEKEVSATIVWSELNKANKFPLIWNIYPMHPHKIGNNKSNRTPSITELRIGLEFTEKLIKLFDINYVICIGKKSKKMIEKLDIKNDYVRHPSMGGANLFRDQISTLLK